MTDHIIPSEKYCPKCKTTKHIEDFYESKRKASAWCKQCWRDYQSQWRKSEKGHRLIVRRRDEVKANPSLKASERRKFLKYANSEHGRYMRRNYHLRRSYGITYEEADAMYVAQDGRCAICRTPHPLNRLQVDHCHSTGKIRALLCLKCNAGLGSFDDSSDKLKAAMEYILKHKV